MPPEPAFTAILLAGQRDGRPDALAEAHGVANKCLVPVAGVPLNRHVADALLATPGLARLRIVVEPGTVAAVEAALASNGIRADYVDAADNLADSVLAAADGVSGSMVLTTADNVLLTPSAVAAMVAAVTGGADAALAMSCKAAVLAAHPDGQRRFYRFADDEYSNCNLYAFAGPRAMAAVESFRGGGQFAKKPLRLLAAVGPFTLLLLLTHRISLADAMRRMSRKFGLRIAPVIIADGRHAIDVDNERTHKVAGELMAARQ